MKKNIKTVILSLILAVTVFCCLMAVENNMMKKYEQEEIIVAKEKIEKGTQITESVIKSSFKKIKFTKNVAVKGTVKTASELKGKTAAVSLPEGAVVYKSSFISEETAAGIENPVELSISVSTFSNGVSGTLRKGDFVYIYGEKEKTTAEQQQDMENGSETTEDNLIGKGSYYIKDAFTSSGEIIKPGDSVSVASVFTIIVSEEDYGKLCEQISASQEIILIKTDKKTGD